MADKKFFLEVVKLVQRSERQEGMQRSRHEAARPREQLVQGPAAQIRRVEQTAIKIPCCRGEESP